MMVEDVDVIFPLFVRAWNCTVPWLHAWFLVTLVPVVVAHTSLPPLRISTFFVAVHVPPQFVGLVQLNPSGTTLPDSHTMLFDAGVVFLKLVTGPMGMWHSLKVLVGDVCLLPKGPVATTYHDSVVVSVSPLPDNSMV